MYSLGQAVAHIMVYACNFVFQIEMVFNISLLTLEPPEVFVYLKPPPGQIDPLLECIDFQGKTIFY